MPGSKFKNEKQNEIFNKAEKQHINIVNSQIFSVLYKLLINAKFNRY